MIPVAYLTTVIALLLASGATAQGRCDCSVKFAACEAAISLNEKSFALTSNTSQCSKLEWVLDKEGKQPDGKATERRFKTKTHPDFWLKSCYVCADTKFRGERQASGADEPDPTTTVIGKWCSQDEKGKASHTITRDGAVTKLDFGGPGRKFDKFSCNASPN